MEFAVSVDGLIVKVILWWLFLFFLKAIFRLA